MTAVVVHATAVVEPGAELGQGTRIGPFCFVGGDVSLGPGSELVARVVLLGPARFGRDNRFFPGATLGAEPQDTSYAGEPTTLEVGDRNTFRENVTVHRGSARGSGVTRVGSDGLFMVGAHIAHDCCVGDGVVLTNLVSLGGHVVVGDGVNLGGHVAVAPFARLGERCFVAGGAMVERGVPPFVIAHRDRARPVAINRVGLRRAGAPEGSVASLVAAHRFLFRSTRPLTIALRELPPLLARDPWVARLVEFLNQDYDGGRSRRTPGRTDVDAE